MTCPNCGTLMLGKKGTCPTCHYDFALGRISDEWVEKERIKKEKKQKELEEKERLEKERIEALRNAGKKFDYKIEMVSAGRFEKTQEILDTYSNQGWRVVNISTINIVNDTLVICFEKEF